MTERDAFIQAICQDPQNDTTRLIFADWLEERGDPLGEFIRVQIRLHNEGEYVGNGAVHDNQLPCERVYNREDPVTGELWQRCFELIKENREEWTRGFLDSVDVIGWSKGHVGIVNVSGWSRGFPSSVIIPVRIWNAKADELLLKYPLEKVLLNNRGGRQRPERKGVRESSSVLTATHLRLPGRAWVEVPAHERANYPKWLYEHYWPGIKFVL